MDTVKVCVMLSSYNGEKYIREQIDSILAQELPEQCDLSLIVRDDGSTDGTIDILAEYEGRGLLTLIQGENLGVTGSFFALLNHTTGKYDYYSFSDQDDRWHEDKMFRALSVLSRKDKKIPHLYCSEYYYCDETLGSPVPSTHNKLDPRVSLLLFENTISGNTIVFNDALASYVIQAGRNGIYCHDWWVALVASAVGDIEYDDQFYSLDYRRDGRNVSPTGSGQFRLLQYRIKHFIKGDELNIIGKQIAKFASVYRGKLSKRDVKILDVCTSNSRIRKAFLPVRLRQTISGEFMLRTLFLIGKL